MRIGLSNIIFFLCTLNFYNAHASETSAALDRLAKACEFIGGISCEYTYQFKEGDTFGDYLRAGSVISQIRKGNLSPSIDEKQIRNALAHYNYTETGTQKSDGIRYSTEINFKRGDNRKGYKKSYFDDKQYWTQNQPGLCWDILPRETYNDDILIYNALSKILFSAGSTPSGLAYCNKNISSLIKEYRNTKNLDVIKTGTSSFRVKIIDPTPIRIDNDDYNDVYEIEFAVSSDVQITAQYSYRVEAKRARLVDSGKLRAAQMNVAYFEKHIPTKLGFYVPTQIRLPNYTARSSTLGNLTDGERQTLKSIMPKYDLDAAHLISEHVIQISNIKLGEHFSDSEFTPPITKNSVIYNYVTQKYEKP